MEKRPAIDETRNLITAKPPPLLHHVLSAQLYPVARILYPEQAEPRARTREPRPHPASSASYNLAPLPIAVPERSERSGFLPVPGSHGEPATSVSDRRLGSSLHPGSAMFTNPSGSLSLPSLHAGTALTGDSSSCTPEAQPGSARSM